MKIIRVFAVGLLTSAVFMSEFGQQFLTRWLQSEPFSAWAMALQAISPAAAANLGSGALPIIVFCLLTLGAGLFLSATLYSVLDDLVLSSVGWIVGSTERLFSKKVPHSVRVGHPVDGQSRFATVSGSVQMRSASKIAANK